MAPDDENSERIAELEATIDELRAEVRSLKERGAESALTRRGALGLGAIGLGGLLGTGATSAAASGSVGTPSNPVDIYATSIRSDSVGTDELSVGDDHAIRDITSGIAIEHEPSGERWTFDDDGTLASASVATDELSITRYQQSADYVLYSRDGDVRALNQATASEEFVGSLPSVLSSIFSVLPDACVHIKRGTYEIETATTIPEEATIRGDGNATELVTTAATVVFDLDGNNHVTIRDLYLEGDGVGTSAIVAPTNPKFLDVSNVYVHGFEGWGIDIREGWVVSLRDVVLRGCGDSSAPVSGAPEQSNGGGLRLSNDTAGELGESNAVTCSNVYAQNNHNIAVRFGKGGTKRFAGGAIEGNYGHGVVIASGAGRSVFDSVWFESNGYGTDDADDVYDVYYDGRQTTFRNCTWHGSSSTASFFDTNALNQRTRFEQCHFQGTGLQIGDSGTNWDFIGCRGIPDQIVSVGNYLRDFRFEGNSGPSPHVFSTTTNSNGQASIDFGGYAFEKKPVFDITFEGPYSWHVVSWSQDSFDGYTSATIEVTDTGGTTVGSGIAVTGIANRRR